MGNSHLHSGRDLGIMGYPMSHIGSMRCSVKQLSSLVLPSQWLTFRLCLGVTREREDFGRNEGKESGRDDSPPTCEFFFFKKLKLSNMKEL